MSGPGLALAILSGMPVDRFVSAVDARDVAALRAIPGVGNKTAERILVELRDKVASLAVPGAARPADDIEEATVSALVNLGYPRAHAEKLVRGALERLPVSPSLENLVREALRAATR